MARASSLPRRIDHVGIVVADIQAAADRLLGLFRVDLAHVADVLGGTVRLGYLDVGDTTIQLVQPMAPGPIADWLSEKGEGLHHLCFLVDDIDATLEEIADDGPRHVYLGGRGTDVCFIGERPCGVLVELTEPMPAGWSPSAPQA